MFERRRVIWRSPCLLYLIACLLWVGVGASSAQSEATGFERYRVVWPFARRLELDYLAIVPQDNAEALSPLLAYRAGQGLAVGALVLEDVVGEAHGEQAADLVRSALKRAWRRSGRRLRFVLLAGDTDTIPAFHVAAIPTDHPYACPEGADRQRFALGRLPARTAGSLARMVQKTLAYERRAPGPWQKELSFFAGVGGFKFDRALEMITSRVLSREIPPSYDIDMTYASPSSPWFYPPKEFASHLRARIEAGPLFVTFIGHGSPSGTQRIEFAGRSYPILDRRTVRSIDTGKTCGMVVLACSTGAYAELTPCIGELLLDRPGGVAWFYGASIESAPFGNAAIGEALVRHALQKGAARTVGEAIRRAEQELLDSLGRRLIGLVVSRLSGVSTSGDEIREHVLMYNLLGDPALTIRRPAERIALALEWNEETHTVQIRGEGAPAAARVHVTLEGDRPAVTRRLEPVDPTKPGWEERVRRNHRLANDKVLARSEVKADESGRFEAVLSLPERAREDGSFYVKASAIGEGTLVSGGLLVRRPAASQNAATKRAEGAR